MMNYTSCLPQVIWQVLPVLAAGQSTDQMLPQPAELPSVVPLLLRIVASLVLILVIAWYTARFLRQQQVARQIQKKWIKILDYQALGTNKGIYLVECFERIYVLGVSEGQINVLQEFSAEDEIWVEYKEDILNNIASAISPFFIKTNKDKEENFDFQLSQQLNRLNQISRRLNKRGGQDE